MITQDEYVVIIGDIIQSREIEERDLVQKQFIQVLKDLNDIYDDEIASQFIITAGDEFQGLLKTKKHILEIIEYIDISLYPTKLRYGIGEGLITSTINKEKSNEIDGPAYHRARRMIEEIEENEKGNQKPIINIMIDTGHLEDEILNASFALMSTIKSTWTKRQTEVVYAYLGNNNNQHITAAALNVQQSTINRSLNAANYYSFSYAKNKLSKYLQEKEEQ